MADWASANCVASLPSAFSTVKSEVDRPAAVKACFRYGASNSTYRVEETVSGRITVTLPLPAAVTDLRPAIALKELFRSPTEIDAAGAVALLVGVEEEVAGGVVLLLLPPLLQAAIRRAAAVAAAAVAPALADTEYTDVPRFI